MKGIIIVNAFLRPNESVRQAERMKKEFSDLGVTVDIVNDGAVKSMIKNGKIQTELAVDFALFLDKDKYLSYELENAGIRLFNSHAAIRACDDKGETCLLLSGSGLKIPDTVFGALSYSEKDEEDIEYAEKIAKKVGFPIVVKESFGSMGKGVYKADDVDGLVRILSKIKNRPHIFQKYLGKNAGEDIRVIVIGGRAVSAIKRKNPSDFRSNVALGGSVEKIDLSDEFKSAAEKAATVLGLDYCGVDLLVGDDGSPFVCEVNSNAFFEGFERATDINVAALYARHIINCVKYNK